MATSTYKLGKNVRLWSENAQTISFVVTEDCNLRCKYCYITHKASNKVLEFETAKKFIDYLFSDAVHRQEAATIEFIGGEPCIEMGLIDRICDYFKLKAYEEGSDWYWNYRISICTNGVNYSSDEVQRFIKKNIGKLSMTISIDGTKEKHDSQRVFPNGSGSYDIIEKNLPLYISQFGGHTKATFSRDDLPVLKDSIISLWNKGIVDIASNVIFEDVWQDGDDLLFESQLKALADYALDHHLFDKYICTFFQDNIGAGYTREDLTKTWCGAGRMLALGPNGNIYPCIRYKDYSLNNHDERIFGNIHTGGINMDLVKPFLLSQIRYQSDNECLNCDIAIGCAFCQGFNYDEAEIPTNFYRAKYICKMHKARVRANDYYFSKLYNRFGLERENQFKPRKKLYFLLADDHVSYCQYDNRIERRRTMSEESILSGLQFARNNFFSPVFVHSRSKFSFDSRAEYDDYHIQHIVPAKFYEDASSLQDCMFVFGIDDCSLPINGLTRCQLNIDSHEIDHLFECVKTLTAKAFNIHINIMNLDPSFDEKKYREQLFQVVEYIHSLNCNSECIYEINLLDELLTEASRKYPEHNGCMSGSRTFVFAPDNQLYSCVTQYNQGQPVGTPETGITNLKFPQLYKLENMPLCTKCDAYQCSKCIAVNEEYTKEKNVPPSFMCHKSMIEKDAVIHYAKLKGQHTDLVPMRDPMEALLDENDVHIGIYKF